MSASKNKWGLCPTWHNYGGGGGDPAEYCSCVGSASSGYQTGNCGTTTSYSLPNGYIDADYPRQCAGVTVSGYATLSLPEQTLDEIVFDNIFPDCKYLIRIAVRVCVYTFDGTRLESEWSQEEFSAQVVWDKDDLVPNGCGAFKTGLLSVNIDGDGDVVFDAKNAVMNVNYFRDKYGQDFGVDRPAVEEIYECE